MKNLDQSNNPENSHLIPAQYLAGILHDDGSVLKHFEGDDPDALLSRAILSLESEYPNGLCQIKDLSTNQILAEIKPRHCYD